VRQELCWSAAGALGRVILQYSRYTGDAAALDHALTLLHEACHSGPSTGPAHAVNAFRLGAGLWTRYEWSHCRTDLDAAISELQQAHRSFQAAAEDTDALCASTGMSLLGYALHRRFELTGCSRDLDLASQALRDAPCDCRVV